MREPVWMRLLDLSTAHLSAAARALLDRPDPRGDRVSTVVDPAIGLHESRGHHWIDGGAEKLLAVPFEFGWFVYVPDLDTERAAGVSMDLAWVFAFARKHRCEWLKIDADGTVYDELAQFEEPGG